jgi:hypothetical protein
VTRVGFLFGSNENIRVPVTISRAGLPTGSMPIVVPIETLRFFAFEDGVLVPWARFPTGGV